MSEAAVRDRASRQRQAAPGSGHDRVLAFARVALPSAAGVLVALLATAPLTHGSDISFILDKNKVDVAKERMRAEAAQYRGQDNKGQPFSLTAGSAVQTSSADPTVRISDIAARLALPDGPASITATKGRYDMAQQRVAIDGTLLFSAANGYRLATRDVAVDMKTRRMESGGPVEGQMPLGTFSAGRLSADLGDRHVVLDHGARLKIVQGGLK